MLMEPLLQPFASGEGLGPIAEEDWGVDDERLERWTSARAGSSRSPTHLDSAKDRHGADVSEEDEKEEEAAAAAAAAAGPPSAARAAARPQRNSSRVTLQKGLIFSDADLEAEYQGVEAEAGRGVQLQWVALRAWLWAACALRLLAAGLPGVAAGVAAACVLPSAAHALALAFAWPTCKRHLLVAAFVQGLADVAGFAAVRPLYAVATAAGAGQLAAGPLQASLGQLCQLPCHAAAYLTFSSLRHGPPFIVRFATATALLAAQFFTLGSLHVEAARASGGGGGPPGCGACNPLGAALLAAAYCLPLIALYHREARQRLAFVKARPGLRVDTSHVDPLADSLSFVLPAVVQVLSLWNCMG